MARDEPFSEIEKKVQIGLELGVFNDSLGQKLLQLHRRGILDQWSAGQIISRVTNGQRKEAARSIPFRSPRLNSGELILGADTNRNPIKSHVQYLNAGSLLVANTGSGKTTLVCFYATQIAHQVRGMWLVDLRKKEFRVLRPEFAGRGIDLMIVRSRELKINPLQVPYCTDPHEYASTIADVLIKVLNRRLSEQFYDEQIIEPMVRSLFSLVDFTIKAGQALEKDTSRTLCRAQKTACEAAGEGFAQSTEPKVGGSSPSRRISFSLRDDDFCIATRLRYVQSAVFPWTV